MEEGLKPNIGKYKISDGYHWATKSIYSPVKALDVLSRLKKFKFGLSERVFYVVDDEINTKFYSYFGTPESDIPTIHGTIESDNYLILSSITTTDANTRDFVSSCYNKLFGNLNPMISSEVIFYNSAREYIGLTSELHSLDLIRTQETYTNRVDIGEVAQLSTQPGITCFADITIQYQKGEDMYFRNLIIPVFSYDSDGKLNIRDLKSEITNSNNSADIIVILDAQKYIIEAIPFDPNSDISECIINRCTIKYGKY